MSPLDPAPVRDHLGGPQPRPGSGRGGRRVAWLAVGAVGAAAAIAGGIWGWQAWTEQGAQPSQALPADTLAYVALDFDPPGQQKAAALGSLRKFPSASRELGLESADDLLRSLVEEVASEAGCTLDHPKQVAPWIGDRVAFAVVPQSRVEPVVVLQVEDAAAAGTGLGDLVSTCTEVELGRAVEGDWAVLARTDAVAARVLADAAERPLSQDGDFGTLVASAGDPGVATVFAAPEAGAALLAEIEEQPYLAFTVLPMAQGGIDPMSGLFLAAGMWSIAAPSVEEGWEEQAVVERPRKGSAHGSSEAQPGEYDELDAMEPPEAELLECQGEGDEEECFGPGAPRLPDELRAALAGFTGLGGVARFEDGALGVEVVTDRLEGTARDIYRGGNAGATVSALPAGSAVALGAGLADGWVQAFLDSAAQQTSMFGGLDEGEAVANIERATGLDLPEDLEALAGTGLSLVVAEGFDPDIAFEGPAGLRVAAHVLGDPAGIEAALDKLRTKVGTELLQSRRVAGGVVVGPNAGFLDELAAVGASLGDSSRFTEAVPGADGADSLMYVDFDAGDWLVRALDTEEERADAAPLDALGMSVTPEGDRDRIRLRLTFD